MRVLVVDDEPAARQRLRGLLADCPGAELAGEAEDGESAVQRCTAGGIDLVLLDIRMPGMDGMATAQRLAALASAPDVIFLTACDDRALDAFETGAVDYLLKPVRRERLQQALQRAGRRRPPPQAARRHFAVRRAGTMLRVPVESVLALRAEDKYVCLVTADGEHLVEESLAAIEREFGDRFLRIHRNCLVATGRLAGLVRQPDGSERARVDGLAQDLEISRRNLPAVRAWLQGRGG
ncbi:MAG: response regulator transcription factor [Xanthomonadales bacterium]|nr:response regulator transcription factor [Xanthomonadales bacterium]